MKSLALMAGDAILKTKRTRSKQSLWFPPETVEKMKQMNVAIAAAKKS
jgi:hypothetical protein